MKSKLILIALLSLALPALADPKVNAADLIRAKLAPPETLVRYLGNLGLTQEQKSEIESLLDKARSEAPALEATIQECRERLELTITAAAGPLTAAETQLDALLQAEGDLKRLQLRTIFGTNAALTPEQRQEAISLAKREMELRPVIEKKVARIKAAVDSLGCEPTQAIQQRGQAVSHLMETAPADEADRALDQIIADLGMDESVPPEEVDFSTFDPGDTDLAALEQRFSAVERKVQTLVRLSTLRQMMKAHQALENAKAAEDPVAAGRVLTWAESFLP